MSKLYRSREGTVTAVDTKTQLATLGSESAPGPLLVPAGAKQLNAIITAIAPDLGVATDTGYIVRLEGPGLPEGPEVINVGASGVQVATGGSFAREAQRFELNIPVVAGNEILVFGEMVGEDAGNAAIGVTLEFGM